MGYFYTDEEYLEHHGVLGQKWGVRRFQNKDGSLTAAGRKRAIKDARSKKWTNEEHQPSSVRASIAAGKYAAMPTKRNADKLDALNDADAARWKAAKQFKDYDKDKKKLLSSSYDVVNNKNYYDAAKRMSSQNPNDERVKNIKSILMVDLHNSETTYEYLSSDFIKKYGELPISKLNTSIKAANKILNDDAIESSKRKEQEYNQKRNSFKTDEEKDFWEDNYSTKGVDLNRDTYGFLSFKSKDKLPVTINSDNDGDYEKDQRMVDGSIKAAGYVAKKENLNAIKDKVVENMMNDEWGGASKSEATKEGLKNNVKVYGMYVSRVAGDDVYGEINCEHRKFNDPVNSPYGDHSIDVEFSYNTKTKKMDISNSNSING